MYIYQNYFHSHGKILLTGEYLILHGALGLAFPTCKGQSLTVFEKRKYSSILIWKSYDKFDKLWFEVVFRIPDFKICYKTDKKRALKLRNILLKLKKIRKNFLSRYFEKYIETKLEFSIDWGLGSSSTLINNISKWSGVNPYMLLEKDFYGSGYDIACSSSNTPIIYKLYKNIPYIFPVQFKPKFINQLFFLHLNKKQNTRKEINFFLYKKKVSIENINYISYITLKIVFCKTLIEFEQLLIEHETIISNILKLPTIKELYFPDYMGVIKSLGAWGGDFVLVSFRKGMKQYFFEKGYNTIIPFRKMIFYL